MKRHGLVRMWRWLAAVTAVVALGAVAFAQFYEVPLEGQWRTTDAGPAVYGTRGMVVSAGPLASAAGLEILMKGGNAFDAAVAVSATLPLTTVGMTSPLGAGFGVFYDAKKNRVMAADFNAQAPLATTPEMFPTRDSVIVGITATLIPGVVKSWGDILERYGTMTLEEVLAPAIRLAEEGVPLNSQLVAAINGQGGGRLAAQPTWMDVYYYNDRPWEIGDLWVNKAYADTLRRIAREGVDSMYGGSLGREMVDWVRENGGYWTYEDLETYEVIWSLPLHSTYRGYDVYGAQPSSSALTWMETLNILEGYDLGSMEWGSPEYLHLMIEAHKRAHIDGYTYIGDPRFKDVPTNWLLSKEHAAELRAQIDTGGSWNPPSYASVDKEDILKATTHFIVIDAEGNVASITNTLGQGYGSGVVLGDTGMVMTHGAWFDYNMPNLWTGENPSFNVMCCGKRNRYTLSPGIIFKDGKPTIVIGGATGDMTQFGITQPIVNMIDFGMDVSAALNAPRVAWRSSHVSDMKTVVLSYQFPESTREALRAMGHDVEPLSNYPRGTYGTTNAAQILGQGYYAPVGNGYFGVGYAMSW